jgi:hypothetical protein
VPGAPSTPGIRRSGSTVACGSDPSVSILRPNRCGQIGARHLPRTRARHPTRRIHCSLGLRPERIDTAAKSVRPNRCQVEVGARHLPGTRRQVEVGARHLPRTRRDASNLRAGLEVGARRAGSRCQAPVPGRGGMLAICGAGWKSVPGTCPRTRRDASNLRPDWKSVPGTCPRRAGMLAICGRTGSRCQAPAKDAAGC